MVRLAVKRAAAASVSNASETGPRPVRIVSEADVRAFGGRGRMVIRRHASCSGRTPITQHTHDRTIAGKSQSRTHMLEWNFRTEESAELNG